MKMVKKVSVIVITVALMLLAVVPVLAAGTSVNLISMHEMESEGVSVIEDEITDSYGNTYTNNVLQFQTDESAYITYDLNGAYDTFDMTIVCGENTGSQAVMSVGIYADGVKVYDLTGYTRQKPAESLSIDVKGVGELAIKTTKTDGYDSYLYFVNSSFTKADTSADYPQRSELSDLVLIDSQSSEVSNRLLVDVFGNVHNGWTKFSTWDEGYALFNLDKKFVTLTGSIVTSDQTGKDAVMNIEFYVDDKLVYSEKNITRTTPAINFDLDVSNASVLKIATSTTDGYDQYLFVSDGILKEHEHTLADWTVKTEATCSADGEKVRICSECQEIVVTEKIPATGHTPDGKWETTKEATCTEEGEQVQHCLVCKETCENKIIDKLPHTPSEDWEILIEATCQSEGTRIKKCTVCGNVAEEEAIPMVDHSYGEWKTISGSVWNNPIVKERTCSVCGDVDHVESNATSWLKPLIIVLFIIIIGSMAVIVVTLKMNGLALEPASIKKLFSKENLTDDEIDNILNKSDENMDNK